MKINEDSFLTYNRPENGTAHQITQHIRCGFTPLPFGTLLPMVATSYMLRTLSAMNMKQYIIGEVKMKKQC